MMRIRVGDTIRADGGGGRYYSGTVDSMAFGKIRVRLPGGSIVEVDERGRDHTVNGHKKSGEPPKHGHKEKLRELDGAKNLSEWEEGFVGDLIQKDQKHFTTKQVEMIERIYNRRIMQNA